MATRREILEASLAKKEASFNAKLSEHMQDVIGAQGEPMAGHKRGDQVLARWRKQESALKRADDGIQKTKTALEREDYRDAIKAEAANVLAKMPLEIQALVSDGVLSQWTKHPTFFFVDGVDKARIRFNDGVLSHRYAGRIEDKNQYAKFRDTYNELNRKLNKPS